MPRPGPGLLIGWLAIAATAAQAAPPTIGSTKPLGVQRGVATEVTIAGTNLTGNPRLVAPFGAEVVPVSGDGAKWTFRLTAAADTAVGVYPIRVRTDAGVSPPTLFAIGQVPQVEEAEENSTFEVAQPIPTPAVVEGKVAGNDVDFFRFKGQKGQRVVVDAQCARIGSAIDPSIRLTTAARGYVASADDSAGLLTDARIAAVLPEDGDYVVEISDTRYAGGADRPGYRLLVGAVPTADEVYPTGGRRGETVGFELRGGTLAGPLVAAATLVPADGSDLARFRVAGPGGGLDVESLPAVVVGEQVEVREPADPAAAPVRVVAPATINGRIDPARDEDTFTLMVVPGQALRIAVSAADAGSSLDAQVRLLGGKGEVLATADDTVTPIAGSKKKEAIVSADPTLRYTVPAGVTEVALAIRDLQGKGGVGYTYRVDVAASLPAFEVVLAASEASVPRGGTAAVPVTVARRGYIGPISLSLDNPPAGLTARPSTLAENQTAGVITIAASAGSAFGPAYVRVVARGQGADGPIVRSATKLLVFAKSGNFPIATMLQPTLVVADAEPDPVVIDAPDGPIALAHGTGTPVVLKAVRAPGADAELAITPLPLPAGLAVAAAKLEAAKAEATVVVSANADAPLGASTIGLVAKGKFANVERTMAVPSITFDVVRPVGIELAAPKVEVRAGASAEVKGKIVRRGAFREPVPIKLDGLPAGTKAEPSTLAPDATEFTLTIVAEPTAPAATAAAKVVAGFQLDKKDYPTPPAPLEVKVLPAAP